MNENMNGILLNIDIKDKKGQVDTRNSKYGILTIYFSKVPDKINIDATVEFEIITSARGNKYAKFIKVVDRNNTKFNTEDRNKWYKSGESEELVFINEIVPKIGVDLIINPEKENTPWKIDLVYKSNKRYADLKTQNTPFFTASRYFYRGKKYDPAYTVTFNKKDYENYKQSYPDCDIYFWVNWTQLEYKDISLEPVNGVWMAPFKKISDAIESGIVQLHSYKNRKNDDYNAKESYLLDLNDNSIFEKYM